MPTERITQLADGTTLRVQFHGGSLKSGSTKARKGPVGETIRDHGDSGEGARQKKSAEAFRRTETIKGLKDARKKALARGDTARVKLIDAKLKELGASPERK